MDNTKNDVIVCEVCGTEMVSPAQPLSLDGTLSFDGSSTLGGLICPKCHPDLVESN